MNEIYDLEDIYTEEVEQGKEPFRVLDDKTADWCIKIIKQEEAETERLIDTINQEIDILKAKKERLQNQLQSKTGFLKGKLAEYFDIVEKKELKTQLKYTLPSGSLVFVKPSISYERDNEKILNWLTENNKYEYIKTNPSVDWSSLKANEDITKIDGVTPVEQPAKFEVR